MASIGVTYTGPADGATATLTHSGTIPDAASPALFAYYRDAYGAFFDNLLKVPTKSAVDSTGKANAAATDAQIFDAIGLGIATSIAAQVSRFAAQQAANQAAAAVTPVTFTKTA